MDRNIYLCQKQAFCFENPLPEENKSTATLTIARQFEINFVQTILASSIFVGRLSIFVFSDFPIIFCSIFLFSIFSFLFCSFLFCSFEFGSGIIVALGAIVTFSFSSVESLSSISTFSLSPSSLLFVFSMSRESDNCPTVTSDSTWTCKSSDGSMSTDGHPSAVLSGSIPSNSP